MGTPAPIDVLWAQQPAPRGADSCAGSSVVSRLTRVVHGGAGGSVAIDDQSHVSGYTLNDVADDASYNTYPLAVGDGALDERERRVVLSSSDEEAEDPPARVGAQTQSGRRESSAVWSVVPVGGAARNHTQGELPPQPAGAASRLAAAPRVVSPRLALPRVARHDADSAAGVGARVPRPVVPPSPSSAGSDGASTLGGVSHVSGVTGMTDLTNKSYSFKSTATEYEAATTVRVEVTAAERGQGSDSFSRFTSETLLSAVGSVVVWLGVLYMVPTVGEPCAAEGAKSFTGLLHFAKGFSLNLVFLQVPSAVGTCIATVLVLDYKTLSRLHPLEEHSLPRSAVKRVVVLAVPRLLLQVVVKYLCPKEASGGVLVLMNMVCTYVTPFLWTSGRRWHHHMVTLPIVYIYFVMAGLAFVILPGLLTQSAANPLHYVLGPVIIGAVELVMIGGVAVVMRLCGAWDLRNSSVWARTIFTMFLGFKIMMLTNERLGPGVLFGTVASLVCVETALQLLPVEALLRQLPTVASGCKRGWARARDTCCRRGGDADAEAAADAEPAPTKGRQKRANFVEAYMASKKDAMIAPLIAIPIMKMVQHNPFPEAFDCKTGQLLEGVDMEWWRLCIAVLTIVACEVVPNLVRKVTGSSNMHFLYGPYTVVTPPNMFQRIVMHMNQATVTVFSLTLALILVPGGPTSQ